MQELGSQPLPTINVTEDVDGQQGGRPRSGTWGSRNTANKSENQTGKDGDKQKQSKHKSGSRSGSTSRSSSTERRKSGDRDDQMPSPSRKQNLLDAFRPRSKSDAAKNKNKGTLMSHMKSAMQVSKHNLNLIFKTQGQIMSIPDYSSLIEQKQYQQPLCR